MAVQCQIEHSQRLQRDKGQKAHNSKRGNADGDQNGKMRARVEPEHAIPFVNCEFARFDRL
jgi:hypothetical protein